MPSPSEAVASLDKTFGPTAKHWLPFVLQAPRLAINALGHLLDRALFPGLDTTPLDRPVYVLGHPRSGTTLMHRLLARHPDLAPSLFWEFLLPPVSLRRALDPLVTWAAPRLPPPPGRHDIHELGFTLADTDDAGLLLNHLDGPLYEVAIGAWTEEFPRRVLDPVASAALAERLIGLLERAMRRNVVARRRPRALVKTSVVTAAMPQALARQPDAKMIVLLRDPLEVIPSTMSLAEHMWLPRIRTLHNPTEAQLARYYEHLYQASQRMLMGLVHWREAGLLPPERALVVPYRRLVADPEGVMREVLRFAELPEAPELLAELAPKQRGHKSQHRYTLAQYGLTEERVRADLAALYAAYPEL
ncbi:sulfotransferase [Myxococcota bacterium]|nr:sulfotransferase [Myxococcota bacterium]